MHQAEGAHLHRVWAVRRVSLTEVGNSSFSRTKDSFSLVSRRKPSSFAILVITNYSRYSHSILQPVFVSPLRDYKFSQTQAYVSFFFFLLLLFILFLFLHLVLVLLLLYRCCTFSHATLVTAPAHNLHIEHTSVEYLSLFILSMKEVFHSGDTWIRRYMKGYESRNVKARLLS